MQNPKDLLGIDPNGAFKRREDIRDYEYGSKEIGFASAPFDWNKGYDVEADVAAVLGHGFQLPTKDQGTAGSCGGEAISTYAHVLTAAYLNDTTEKSAKAPYAQVYVPGGGSNDRELANIYIKQGIYKESLVPSYPLAGVVTEAFMERASDITSLARLDASKESAMFAYSFPVISIDTIAQVIRDCRGVMMGLYGSNNGTWLSAEPKPPRAGEERWAHYMYFGKAFMEHGVKKIWGKQSWGPNVGINGWQKLDQTYFNSGSFWSAMALTVSNRPVALPHVSFATDMHLGDHSTHVYDLQTALAYDGVFNVAPTGYYGAITAQAVLRFQLKYKLATIATLEQLGGNTVGPATRQKLNQLT